MLSAPDSKTSAWSNRLVELIKASDNPEAEMNQAAYLMSESGILDEEPVGVSAEKFAQLVLEENWQMPVQSMTSLTDLREIETVEDLISNLLPSRNALD